MSHQWTMEDFESIYSRFKSSGLSVMDFCSNECIRPKRFYEWRSKLLRKDVHPIVYGNKVNIMLREHDLGIHTHLQIITAKTGHIFDDDPFDDPCLHIGNHFLETRPIEGCSRNAVINVKAEVGVPVFKSVLL